MLSALRRAGWERVSTATRSVIVVCTATSAMARILPRRAAGRRVSAAGGAAGDRDRRHAGRGWARPARCRYGRGREAGGVADRHRGPRVAGGRVQPVQRAAAVERPHRAPDQHGRPVDGGAAPALGQAVARDGDLGEALGAGQERDPGVRRRGDGRAAERAATLEAGELAVHPAEPVDVGEVHRAALARGEHAAGAGQQHGAGGAEVGVHRVLLGPARGGEAVAELEGGGQAQDRVAAVPLAAEGFAVARGDEQVAAGEADGARRSPDARLTGGGDGEGEQRAGGDRGADDAAEVGAAVAEVAAVGDVDDAVGDQQRPALEVGGGVGAGRVDRAVAADLAGEQVDPEQDVPHARARRRGRRRGGGATLVAVGRRGGGRRSGFRRGQALGRRDGEHLAGGRVVGRGAGDADGRGDVAAGQGRRGTGSATWVRQRVAPVAASRP